MYAQERAVHSDFDGQRNNSEASRKNGQQSFSEPLSEHTFIIAKSSVFGTPKRLHSNLVSSSTCGPHAEGSSDTTALTFPLTTEYVPGLGSVSLAQTFGDAHGN
jgi:hypothetical protein